MTDSEQGPGREGSSEVSYSYAPLGTSNIIPDSYLAKCPRPKHGPLGFNVGYFFEEHRLTEYEFGLVEQFGGDWAQILQCGASGFDGGSRLLSCAKGFLRPRTVSEVTLTKLVYQALAMGGIHLKVKMPFEDHGIADVVANDLIHLSNEKLKIVLNALRAQMWRHQKYRDKVAPSQARKNDGVEFAISEEDMWMNDLVEEKWERDNAAGLDLDEELESLGRSEEDGWYYDDDD
jgi:hypothetical protein